MNSSALERPKHQPASLECSAAAAIVILGAKHIVIHLRSAIVDNMKEHCDKRNYLEFASEGKSER